MRNSFKALRIFYENKWVTQNLYIRKDVVFLDFSCYGKCWTFVYIIIGFNGNKWNNKERFLFCTENLEKCKNWVLIRHFFSDLGTESIPLYLYLMKKLHFCIFPCCLKFFLFCSFYSVLLFES